VDDVAFVYGAAIETEISSIGSPDDHLFVMKVGPSHANFRLEEDGGHEGVWRIAAVATLSGDAPEKVHAHRPREWTRQRVEEIVLQLASAFERSRFIPTRSTAARRTGSVLRRRGDGNIKRECYQRQARTFPDRARTSSHVSPFYSNGRI